MTWTARQTESLLDLLALHFPPDDSRETWRIAATRWLIEHGGSDCEICATLLAVGGRRKSPVCFPFADIARQRAGEGPQIGIHALVRLSQAEDAAHDYAAWSASLKPELTIGEKGRPHLTMPNLLRVLKLDPVFAGQLTAWRASVRVECPDWVAAQTKTAQALRGAIYNRYGATWCLRDLRAALRSLNGVEQAVRSWARNAPLLDITVTEVLAECGLAQHTHNLHFQAWSVLRELGWRRVKIDGGARWRPPGVRSRRRAGTG